jgi:hypothetical protein
MGTSDAVGTEVDRMSDDVLSDGHTGEAGDVHTVGKPTDVQVSVQPSTHKTDSQGPILFHLSPSFHP